ncbi:PREDICTED: uncharacterized protein LOC104743738 [Camelina sativa]|uniref:Uncharacterized protein LOC104743738 n=1 Tax=Camelina sativa TaxID=90675 RepID=A0ABM0VYI2_CAMSA|nr:PREDICTED: uncharacterized protein LOC104743738 [Camelina sativa]
MVIVARANRKPARSKASTSSVVRRSTRSISDVNVSPPISPPVTDSQVSGVSRVVASPAIVDPSHLPFFLHNEYHPGLNIISLCLDETKYDDWSYVMRISLDTKNKLKFIDGSLPRPLVMDPNFDMWYRCNSMVKAWLLNVVSPQIYRSILRMNDTTDIWRDLYGRYHLTNLPRTYNLTQEIQDLRQGSLSKYYTRLKTLWDQLDGLEEPDDPCVCGKAARLHLKAKRAKTVKFLAGLNESYVIDDSQKVFTTATPPTAFQVSQAPLAPALSPAPDILYVHNGPNKGRPICSFCNRVGHIVERCYRKHGFPPGFTPKGKFGERTHKPQGVQSVAAQVSLSPMPEKQSIEGMIGNLSKDHLQNIIALFSSQLQSTAPVITPAAASTSQSALDHPSISFSNPVYYFIGILAVSKHILSNDIWVIDSGATHHVSHEKDVFISLDTSVESFVNMPNGQHIKISGVGMDPTKGVIIGKGRRIGKLYVLDTDFSSVSVNAVVDVSVWQKRLGHPSYTRLDVIS